MSSTTSKQQYFSETTKVEPTLSVSQLVLALGKTLEREYSPVSFQGEISELSRAASGHIYFTLKDDGAQIAAVLWRGTTRSLQFSPETGMAVVCEGKPNIYPRSGRLQMVVARMTLAGEGLLQQKFEQLKRKLEGEGLFDIERKRPIPFFPKVIGIVTSAGGAAIHDIMVKIQERMPCTRVVLFDARVQGPGSADEIVAGIKALNDRPDVEVIIIGRGGGSLEDLWSFNEEIVVRAVFTSRLPIISAVGHEVDISLSDLAADLRAPTPTAAGEVVVPSAALLMERLDQFQERLVDLESWFYPLFQQLDDYQQRLTRIALTSISESRLRLETMQARINGIRPDRMFEHLRGHLQQAERSLSLSLLRACERQRDLVDALHRRLVSGLAQNLKSTRSELLHLETRLESVSPLAVLKRGYAIVESSFGLVKDSTQLEVNQEIKLSFARGSARANVVSIRKED